MSHTTRIAITGASGRLGQALLPYFPNADYLSKQSCDVANSRSVKDWFGTHQYDLILHLGAQTAHDASPESLAMVNIVGTVSITQWARKQGARMVYASTDYCYQGTGNHKETDPLLPHGNYAWSKLGGECAVQSYPKSLIVRGSWYSSLEYNKAAIDAFTSKIPVGKAAALFAALSTSTVTGVVNIGGPRRSIYEVVATEFNPRCEPIARRNVQLSYPLPADVSLDVTKMKRILS